MNRYRQNYDKIQRKIHAYIHIYMYLHISISIFISISISIYVYIYIHIYFFLFSCVYIHISVCVFSPPLAAAKGEDAVAAFQKLEEPSLEVGIPEAKGPESSFQDQGST